MIAVLKRQNPWWSEPRSRLDPGPAFRRTAFFTARSHLLGSSPRHLLVLGPRQVGKTTMLKQLALDLLTVAPPTAVCYLRLDDPDLLGKPLGEVVEVYRGAIWSRDRPAYLLLDEVHGSPDWALQLKAWFEDDSPNRVVATGSLAAQLADGSRESGPGRWDELIIGALDLHEYMLLRREGPAEDVGKSSPSSEHWWEGPPSPAPGAVRAAFLDYLVKGGFPASAQQNDMVAAHQLLRDDIYERVLIRDMAVHFGLRSFDTIRLLFRYLAEQSSGIANVSVLSNRIGAPHVTISDVLAHLRETFLVAATSPFSRGKASLRPRPKLYLCDASLRSAVLLQGRELVDDAVSLGRCCETAAHAHLSRLARARGGELSYWRDSRGEVDFVLTLPGRAALLVEVTSGSDTASKVANLERCAVDVGAEKALVLCGSLEAPHTLRSRVTIHQWNLADFLWTVGVRERAEARKEAPRG
jgi:predicted AAA+ superfamily ATPase